MRKLLTGLLVLFLLAACSGGSPASVTGTWSLVSYGPLTEQTPAAPEVETSIEFKDGQINGNVGCNGFGGEYTVDGNTLTFGPLVATLMFCDGPVGEQETVTLNVLQNDTTFDLTGDTLTITSTDGSAAIVLARR